MNMETFLATHAPKPVAVFNRVEAAGPTLLAALLVAREQLRDYEELVNGERWTTGPRWYEDPCIEAAVQKALGQQ